MHKINNAYAKGCEMKEIGSFARVDTLFLIRYQTINNRYLSKAKIEKSVFRAS